MKELTVQIIGTSLLSGANIWLSGKINAKLLTHGKYVTEKVGLNW